jgi:hypothetical protein
MTDCPRVNCDTIQIVTFSILAIFSGGLIILCIYNAYYLNNNGRFKNFALASFYCFTFVALISKSS